MDIDDHERIRDLYRTLTDIGEQASKRVIPQRDITSDPTVPRRSGIGAHLPSPSATSSPVSPSAHVVRNRLPIGNPLRVCGAALRSLFVNLGTFLVLGALFVLLLGPTSHAFIGSHLAAPDMNLNHPFIQLLSAGTLAFVLGSWIRRSGSKPHAPRMGPTEALILAVGIGLTVVYVAPVIANELNLPLPLRWAAVLTRIWPLNGPYASLATGAPLSILPDLPSNAVFFEPFTHAGAVVLPALFLMPFIMSEYSSVFTKWAVFLLYGPMILMAVIVATIPIAVFNAAIAEWARAAIGSENGLQACFLLAGVCYVQVALSGAVIGECYRRIFNTNP